MRILIACEFSGIVRDAFIARGHNAISCDLLPTERPGPHFQYDVRKVIASRHWDMMIAFPPCTYLSDSGMHRTTRGLRSALLTEQALDFVQFLMDVDIPRIAIENPVGVISTRIRKPNQIIHPHQFGHPESKKTCLWLFGLPLLVPTKILPLPECGYWENQTPSGQNKLSPGKDRAKKRSTTYPGIAAAMAAQWG